MNDRRIIPERWQTWRSELLEIFERVKTIADGVERGIDHEHLPSTQSRILEAARNSIHREAFRVMVFGDFSSGKSTLINALLGEDILPRSANPTTAFTTVVSRADERSARLSRDIENSPEMVDVVSIEEFQRQVELRLDEEGQTMRSPYVHGAVYGPFPILSAGVELIDSAGVNEDPERERVTMNYLPLVDAVIYVTLAKAAFKQQDQNYYLDLLRKHGHDDIFFVVNQVDEIEDRDRADVESRCRAIARKMNRRSDPRIYFTSAKQALLARTDPAKADLEAGSNVPALEDALRAFFREGRDRLKLQRPAEVVRQEIFRLREKVRRQREVLDRNAKDLRTILDSKGEVRHNIEHTLRLIELTLKNWTDQSTALLRQQTETFLRKKSEEVDAWAARGRTDVHISRILPAGRRTAAVKLNERLATELDRQMRAFTLDQLNAFIAERQDHLQGELLPVLRDYAIQMEQLEEGLFSTPRTIDDATLRRWLTNMTTSAVTRVEASPKTAQNAGLGILVGGTGAGAALGVFAAVGVASTTAVAAVAAPLVLSVVAIPVVIRHFTNRRVQQDAVREFRQELTNNAGLIAEEYAGKLHSELRRSTDSLYRELEARFREPITAVENAIAAAKQDATKVEDMRSQLHRWEASLAAIEETAGKLAARMLANA